MIFQLKGNVLQQQRLLSLGHWFFDTSIPSESGCTVQSYEYVVDKATGGTLNVKLFGNDTPWAIKFISKTYVSSPTVVVLPNKQVRSMFTILIIHLIL